MIRLIKKNYKKAGLPPGSLVYIGDEDEKLSQVRLSIIEYDESHLIEKTDVAIEECLEHIETPSMTWIQVYGVSDPATIAMIGNRFKLHPLVLEDILNTGHRAKVDVYSDQQQLFIVIRHLMFDEKEQNVKDEQISLVLGPNYLISFVEKDNRIFQPIIQRLRQPNNRIRKLGSDYLAYTLLDTIVDYYFIVLDYMDTQLEALEEELIKKSTSTTLLEIQHTKRDMIILRKSAWPVRELISRLQQTDTPLISPTTQVYLRDVYDHIIQIIDIIEGLRDIAGGLIDIYLSTINIRTNDIMKVLTIVSTIFVPLTFIASIYGMNFDFIPELHYRFAYPLVLTSMLVIAIGMLIYFRRKGWI